MASDNYYLFGIFVFSVFSSITSFLYVICKPQVTGVALFKAVRQGRPSLRVTWTTPQSDVTISQYTLQYKRKGSTVWGRQVTVPPSTTSTILTGLDAGTEYNVRMRAVSAAGDGMWSVEQTERTFDSEFCIICCCEVHFKYGTYIHKYSLLPPHKTSYNMCRSQCTVHASLLSMTRL